MPRRFSPEQHYIYVTLLLKSLHGSLKPVWLHFNFPGPGSQPLSFYWSLVLLLCCYLLSHYSKRTPLPYPKLCVVPGSLLHQASWLRGPFQSTMLSSSPLSWITQYNLLHLQKVFPESFSPPRAVFLNSLPRPIIRQLVICGISSQTFWTQTPLYS